MAAKPLQEQPRPERDELQSKPTRTAEALWIVRGTRPTRVKLSGSSAVGRIEAMLQRPTRTLYDV
jgi:hypothetical protein